VRSEEVVIGIELTQSSATIPYSSARFISGPPSMIGSSPQASYEGDFVDGTNMIVQGKAGNNTVEDDEFDDQKSIVSPSYYSTLSKRTSMVSFFTTKSRLTTDSRESRALYADEPR
jgi:hypothetical protein